MADWYQKIVVVTGGSDGLGLVIARHFAMRRATVVILARDPSRLKSVASDLLSLNPEHRLFGIVADVTDPDSIQQAVARIIKDHQRIDVWINNVGRSIRVPLVESQLSQYRDLMEVNFFSAVECSLQSLPWLSKSSGHLVQIGSLASKTGWPLMAPYSASKHALAAFHHQLRLEGPQNVHYLQVCPGPILRSDAGTRYQDSTAGLDPSAADPGAGVKIKGISPEKLAHRIEVALLKRQPEIVWPVKSRLLFILAQLSPAMADWLLGKMKK